MKQVLHITMLAALVLAGTSLSSQAAMPPDNVGDVTLYGNITANSPMWQWTVNDYPERLNVKPGNADTSVAGQVSYPLNGQWFVAASGYLPSFTGGRVGLSLNQVGTMDITELSSPDGEVKIDVTNGNSARLQIPASSTSVGGQEITGTLTLAADEVRGMIYKSGTGPENATGSAAILTNSSPTIATPGGSCWVGLSLDQGQYSRTGNGETFPTFTDKGPNSGSGAIAEFNRLLKAADTAGTVRWASVLPTADIEPNAISEESCSTPTIVINGSSTTALPYISGAHTLALKPQTVTFKEKASGAWHSTLTVVAHQM